MCKISLKSYETLTTSSERLRLRPDFHVKATPQVYSKPTIALTSHTHSDIVIGNNYNGHDHYTTMYNKMTQPNAFDDSKYETTLVDFKSIKDYSGVNALIRLFINKINTKYSGQTAIRKAFKMMNTSGSNDIGQDDLVSALHMLGIWCYTENDFSLFYIQLAGGIHNMITYGSIKAFIEEHNEFKQSCEI